MDDSEIVRLYWSRSEAAVDETAKKYSGYCARIALNILHTAQDAEECVNDAFLRAWGAIPPARPANLAAFLGKITRNLALNRYQMDRAAKRGGGQTALALSELEDCVPGGGEPEQIVEDRLITQTLNAFLEELDADPRRIFVRRYWYLSGIEEIAEAFGMSVGKVKSILFRLRRRLRKKLEKEGISL